MAPNRIMRGRAVRRALLLAGVALLLISVAAGCRSGGGATSTSERERDEKLLNDVLGRQLAVVKTYPKVLPALSGADHAMAQQFLAQEQEHLDATTKTLRGMGVKAEPNEETIDLGDLRTRADSLEFLYEMESATTDFELSVVGKLNAGSARPLIGSMAANQAQRLVLLRQALGAKRVDAIPSAFETGEIPAPERTPEK